MKVTRLEIFGFKSFLERVVLPVDQGITAIVGPNGCGKSNIVDALRWVFGETRAHQLRGSLLEDVIFNGTETLRPLGLAEVSLVIASDRANLFEDVLAAKDMHSQQVSENVSTNDQVEAEEREEVDGPSSQRPRLVVIEGNLNKQNGSAPETEVMPVPQAINSEVHSENRTELEEDPALARLSWLKLSREVEVTRRLYRSGESEFFINKVACRLRDIKDLFRLLGLGARSYTLVAQGEVSRIITAKPEERRLMIEEAAGVSGVRERLAAAEKRLDDTRSNLTRLHDLISEVGRQVNSLRVQASRARNRAELKERLKEVEFAVFGTKLRIFSNRSDSFRAEVEELKAEEANYKSALDNLLVSEEGIQRDLVAFNTKREELSDRLRQGRIELDAHQSERSSLELESQSLQQQIAGKSAQLSVLTQRLVVVNDQFANAQRELSQFESNASQLQESVATLERSSVEQAHAAIAQLESARRALESVDEKAQEIKARTLELSARMAAIDEQLQNQASDASKRFSGLSPLLSHVRAPQAYAKALEVAVSQYADFHIAEDFNSFLAQYEAGRQESASTLKVMSATPNTKQTFAASLKTASGEAQLLLSHLDVDPMCRALMDELLAGVYFCDNPQIAHEMLASHGDAIRCVTRQGELFSARSFESFGDVSGPVEMLARKRELGEEVKRLAAQAESLDLERGALQSKLTEAEYHHSSALQASVESEQEIRRVTSDLGALRGKIEVISRLVTQLGCDKDALEASTANEQAEEEALRERFAIVERTLSTGAAKPVTSEELEAIEQELAQVSALGKEVIDSLDQRSKDRDKARSRYEEASSKRAQAEFNYEKSTLERQSIEARLHDLYPELDFADLYQTSAVNLSEEEQSSYSEEAERLRTRIAREGEVNPETIALFEQEEKRYEELRAQKEDLESAEKTLAETVVQLADLARRRFLETFDIVQKNFGRLIPRVFGGGFGSLELENEDDPFEGGLNITVRPPGKRPKSIELLSGGERALCAIALIFSMFMHRPSPLCVLDEVDAPLDEANLRRYLAMVREMSTVTQFLMISHNKESMAAADRLVGVTQEQPGASQVVTVSLEEAQAAVA